jgi:hypothetical protein
MGTGIGGPQGMKASGAKSRGMRGNARLIAEPATSAPRVRGDSIAMLLTGKVGRAVIVNGPHWMSTAGPRSSQEQAGAKDSFADAERG